MVRNQIASEIAGALGLYDIFEIGVGIPVTLILEGRDYTALMRHLTLCLVVLGFVAGHAEGLRGEKPGGDGGAGVPGVGVGVPRIPATAAGDR